MELSRIDNLWKFLGIKNGLTLDYSYHDNMKYSLVKGSLELSHRFNPKFLKKSVLIIQERNFQEQLSHQKFVSQKQRFGIKPEAPSPVKNIVFFPKELLSLHHQFDLEIQKDRKGHFRVKISPFVPKTIYDILDTVNLISRTLWVKNFFAEGIRN
ncbi:hypothetical protein A33Q_4293 [Indibacter alkaliphilus LW1]|uniref:Uncharacterized protein n=1 Tax=Indibacter alkaliphilus (strain CCUG 57479 / KCTC 22604 / LW1) TaxID=1189612 RepID=S2D564_INDAL|nr:hypothetical protein [Indibacter alkaliphilus]EOZ92200.1 hypothetical protein A33Q_4293 [Indibacter alkaliphilus LW1]